MMPCTGSGCEHSPLPPSSETSERPAGRWGSIPPRSTGGGRRCSGSARSRLTSSGRWSSFASRPAWGSTRFARRSDCGGAVDQAGVERGLRPPSVIAHARTSPVSGAARIHGPVTPLSRLVPSADATMPPAADGPSGDRLRSPLTVPGLRPATPLARRAPRVHWADGGRRRWRTSCSCRRHHQLIRRPRGFRLDAVDAPPSSGDRPLDPRGTVAAPP